MATRGALGGLCRAAADAVDLMDAAGRDVVFVETVGVGQDEVEIMRVAHTVVVVSVPGLGDDVQALKAGILEVADVHVVNKADREGADRTIAELRAMLTLVPTPPGVPVPPVLRASATREEGIEAIADAVEAHGAALATSGQLDVRRRRAAEARVLAIAGTLIAAALGDPGRGDDGTLIEQVAKRTLVPHAAARALLAKARERERTSHV